MRCSLHFRFSATLIVLLLGVGVSALEAQQLVEWQQASGPPGGYVALLEGQTFSDEIWMISGGSNLYKRTVDDSVWVADQELDFNPAFFYFTSYDTLFTRSRASFDRGKTWQLYGLADSIWVRDIKQDPQTRDLIAATDAGIFRSMDFGANWEFEYAFSTDKVFIGKDGRMYAKTISRIVRSKGRGMPWTTLSSPHPSSPLSVSEKDDHLRLIVDEGPYNMYRSINQGATWTRIGGTCDTFHFLGEGLDGYSLLYSSGLVVKMKPGEERCKRIFDDTRRSYDWLSRNTSIYAITLDAEKRIHLTTGFGGPLESEDLGENWHAGSKLGMNNATIGHLANDPETGKLLASTSIDGLFSSAGNDDWSYVDFASIGITTLQKGLATDEFWFALESGDVFRMMGSGEIEEVNSDSLKGWVHDIDVNPHTGRVFAQAPVFDIYYSDDEGQSWHPTHAPFSSNIDPPILGMELAPNGDLYAGIAEPLEGTFRFFRTRDLGITWEPLSDNLPGLEPYDWWSNVRMVFQDSRLYVSVGEKFFYTDDEGASWIASGVSPYYVNDLLIDPEGAIWAAHANGVVRSVNFGQSWQEVIPDDLHLCVFSLAWDYQKNEIIIGSQSQGIYYGRVVQGHVEIERESAMPKPALIVENFPNPFRSSTVITFELAEAGPVRMVVYDILGREVDVIVDQVLPAGAHQVAFDATRRPSGAYFLVIETREDSFTRRMLHLN